MLVTDSNPEPFDISLAKYQAEYLDSRDELLEEAIMNKATQKEINQLAKSDAGKAKLSLVPTDIIWAIAKIREYGNNKYPDGGPDNWKNVERERYIDACYRHWLRFVKDPTSVDTESGYPHLWHVACNMAFLCEMYEPELKKYR